MGKRSQAVGRLIQRLPGLGLAVVREGVLSVSLSETKVCPMCKEEKPASEFYVNRAQGGRLCSYCKPCSLERKNASRAQRSKYDQAYRAANADKRRRWARERATVKKRAKDALSRAIETGRMVRPANCSECGRSDVQIQGHHPDYSKPLDVVWLCPTCHGAAHRVASVGVPA